MIKAEVIADSVSPKGHRLTTFVVVFPRIILAEFNTHRMFSRNSASSRAIPFDKMLKMVEVDPFIPIAWQEDHKGMQGTSYITNVDHLRIIKGDWLTARDHAVEQAKRLSNSSNSIPNFPSVTKQICNRLLEPFMWHTVIVTSSEYENFFHLRCPQYAFQVTGTESKVNFEPTVFRSRKDALKVLPALQNLTEEEWRSHNKGQAEIHMMALAEAMWDAYNESTPKQLQAGQWHIPFGDKMDDGRLAETVSPGKPLVYSGTTLDNLRVKIATARCARVSYMNFDGSDDYAKDVELHERLAKAGHWSPFEHCAYVMDEPTYSNTIPEGVSGNFQGFVQYRKLFRGENVKVKK